MAGKHLLIDSEGSRAYSRLDSVEFIYRFLEDIVSLSQMQTLIPPHVVRCHDIDNAGITGIVVITTSHSSIHTWPDTGRIRFDLYSCKTFDETEIRKEFERRFQPEKVRAQVVLR